jgi:hypothetical protein
MSTPHSPLLETESETKLRAWRRDPERGMPGKQLPPHRATPVGWALLWFGLVPLAMVVILYFAASAFHHPNVDHQTRETSTQQAPTSPVTTPEAPANTTAQ